MVGDSEYENNDDLFNAKELICDVVRKLQDILEVNSFDDKLYDLKREN